jgi:pimeloyl-[acyl-carrier protein] methyl ester esterase
MNKKNIHLVLIHGFAANKTIWYKLAKELEKTYSVQAVNLPGYGDESSDILQQTKKPVIWVGWSLGGLIARELGQQRPEYTQGIITLASNPKLIASDDWPCGINYGGFHALEKLFIRHPSAALTRFFTLQGQDLERDDRKQLLTLKKQAESVPVEILLRDLNKLGNTDQREMISKLTVPQLNIFGTEDRIVPASVAEQLKHLSPHAQNVTINGAGHVLLLSHVTECLTSIHQFINESITI